MQEIAEHLLSTSCVCHFVPPKRSRALEEAPHWSGFNRTSNSWDETGGKDKYLEAADSVVRQNSTSKCRMGMNNWARRTNITKVHWKIKLGGNRWKSETRERDLEEVAAFRGFFSCTHEKCQHSFRGRWVYCEVNIQRRVCSCFNQPTCTWDSPQDVEPLCTAAPCLAYIRFIPTPGSLKFQTKAEQGTHCSVCLVYYIF